MRFATGLRKQGLALRAAFIWLVFAAVCPLGIASEVTLQTAEIVSTNFLAHLGTNHGIEKIEPVYQSDQLVGYRTDLSPRGYILVAGDTTRVPVKAYSLSSDFDRLPPAYVDNLYDELRVQSSSQNRTAMSMTVEETNGAYWAYLMQEAFPKTYAYVPDTYLLTTKWSQDYPYNKLAPKVGGQSTYTGCIQTALAQVLKYYGYPASGSGVFSWIWNNETLTASMNRPFNWAEMPDAVTGSTAEYQQDEVAALMRDLGIMNEADFGTEETAASFHYESFQRAFGYAPVSRMQSSDSAFFATITNEIDHSRPVLLVMPNHMTVADGYASDGTGRKIHVNLGWGGAYDDYYYLDQTNVIGTQTFAPNHYIYYGIRPCQGDECQPYGPSGTGQAPVIVSASDDAIISGAKILRIDTYDPDGDAVTLSAVSSCPNLQVGVAGNILTLWPEKNDIFCQISLTAQSPDGSAETSFKVLVLEETIYFGDAYYIGGEFASRTEADGYTAYLDGTTRISGYNGYSSQGFYTWVTDSSGNVVVTAGNTDISEVFSPGVYTIHASLSNPFTNWAYYFSEANNDYSLSVACDDIGVSVSDIAASRGISLTQTGGDSDTGSSRIPIYHFYSMAADKHYFTSRESEKESLLANWPEVWTYVGIAWYGYSTPESGTIPVYQFYSYQDDRHYFTSKEAEKEGIISNWSAYWTYVGIAWYAYATQQADTIPVYQFYSYQDDRHYFTNKESEKEYIMAYWSDYWTYVGVAWYGYE